VDAVRTKIARGALLAYPAARIVRNMVEYAEAADIGNRAQQ
jgi:hypothetical protein